jgi:LemA protein
LEDTEDKVAYSRHFYNSNVLDFNTKIQPFLIIYCRVIWFKEFEFFQVAQEDKKKGRG